jgi:hypothetical protein
MRISNELQIGKAGEYIVCADLIVKGFVAFPSEQGLPYDVVMDNGNKLIKIQVKTTSSPRIIPQRAKKTRAYIFNIKRCGKNGSKKYNLDEIDIFALVCLDTKKVGYILNENMPDTINLRVDEFRGSYYDEKGIKDYLKVVEIYKTIKNKSEIARMVGLHVSQVHKMLINNYKPFKTNAKYFSEIERSKDWFYLI